MIDVRDIPLSCIETGQRLRHIDDGQVESLEASILEVGLLNPITVYPRKIVQGGIFVDGYGLIAGAHRLEAYRRLGYDEVPANVVEFSDLERQLAECDENLCGSRLTPAEESLFLKRRKEAYLAIHPETKVETAQINGIARAAADVSANFAPTAFSADTAAKTGQSERAIQLKTERGEKIVPEALEMVRGTKLNRGVYLDKLKGLPANIQITTVKLDLEASKAEQPRQGGIAGRIEPKPAATYEQMREAILFLADLTADDFNRLCPANKRAAMFQKLAHLENTFAQVREVVA